MASRKSDKKKSGKQKPATGEPAETDREPGRLEDDAGLWGRVTETAEPLTRKNRFIDLERPFKPTPRPSQGRATPRGRATPDTVDALASSKKPSGKVAVKKSLSPKAGLDRQTARKLDKGNLAIEARIDLHGMRQREAHSVLRKFLHWARAKDYRHVLVITGKGLPRTEARSFYEEDERGVLRQAVPQWLLHGDLAPIIVSFSEAPRRLGGGGALYVRLRKPDRTRRKL